ncbi:class II histocompatibility antigen beta chain family protein, partial [Aeromonas salmonicida]
NHRLVQCRYSSKDLHGIELIDSYVFNQVENIRFNSTVGKFVGYTEVGLKNAEAWNKGSDLARELGELERFCKHNAANHYSAVLDKTGEQG